MKTKLFLSSSITSTTITLLIRYPKITIVGIGANFACLGGVKPTDSKMQILSSLAEHIEEKFKIPLTYISGIPQTLFVTPIIPIFFLPNKFNRTSTLFPSFTRSISTLDDIKSIN